jgi:hypothetical protein
MQPLLSGLFVLLLAVFLPLDPASAQVEDIILIGGNYRLQGNLHNMQDGFFGAPSLSIDDSTQRFVDTRLRLSFGLRPDSPLSVHYGLEIGDITFGAKNPPIWDSTGHRLENVGSGSGGGEGADGVNLETKNAYLEVEIPGVPGLSFRGGILGWGDQFDWTILATDFTGLQFTYERQTLWTQFTFLQFLEGSLRRDEEDSRWFALDGRYDLTADTDVTASLYLWDDNANDNPGSGADAYQIYAGLKVSTRVLERARLEISGVYNVGQEFLGQSCQVQAGSDQDCRELLALAPAERGLLRTGLDGSANRGFLGSVHVDYPLGKHWLGLTLQYISGEAGSRASLDGGSRDVNAFLGLFNSQYSGFGRSRYTEGGGLELITLGSLNDSTAGLNNVSVSPFFGGGYNGRMLAVLRAKFEVTPVFFAFAALGMDQAAQPNEHGERLRGVEVTSHLHWDLMPKLWLRMGGAMMFVQDWWENNRDVSLHGFPKPLGLDHNGSMEDIFQFVLRLQYDFG